MTLRHRSPRYIATTLPGLEPVLAEEAAQQTGAAVVRSGPGHVVLEAAGTPDAVCGLHCADRAWAYVRDAAVDLTARPGRRGGREGTALRTLRSRLRRTDFTRSLETLAAAGVRPRTPTFRVTTVVGDQVALPYFAIHQSITDALGEASGWTVAPAADLTLLALVEAHRVSVGLMLPRPPGWPGGEHAQEETRVLAAALVWLTRPAPDDVFLDLSPKGTYVLSERRARGKCQVVAAGEALTRLPTADGQVTKLVGAFQRRPVKPEEMRPFAMEISRVLASSGIAAVAAPRQAGLAHTLEQAAQRPVRRLKAQAAKRQYQVVVIGD